MTSRAPACRTAPRLAPPGVLHPLEHRGFHYACHVQAHPSPVRLVLDGLLCTDPARHVERRAVVRRLLQAQLERMSSDDHLRQVHNTMRLLDHEPLDLSRGPRVPALVFTGEHDVYTTPADSAACCS